MKSLQFTQVLHSSGTHHTNILNCTSKNEEKYLWWSIYEVCMRKFEHAQAHAHYKIELLPLLLLRRQMANRAPCSNIKKSPPLPRSAEAKTVAKIVTIWVCLHWCWCYWFCISLLFRAIPLWRFMRIFWFVCSIRSVFGDSVPHTTISPRCLLLVCILHAVYYGGVIY